MRRRAGLFLTSLHAILLGLVLALAVASGLVYLLVLRPLVEGSAEHFATVLLLSARTWSSLPLADRAAFAEELRALHRVAIEPDPAAAPVDSGEYPYLEHLRAALSARLHVDEAARLGGSSVRGFQVDIRHRDRWLRFGFGKDRLPQRPRLALLGSLLVALLAGLASAGWLARRVSRPLAELADAARGIGHGVPPPPLPRRATRELRDLGEALRQMSEELAAQREHQTTLLAGISHDLRSPLARMKMAAGLLAEAGSHPAVQRLEADIAEINGLVEAQLDLARAQRSEAPQPTDLAQLLEDIADAAEAQRPGSVRLHPVRAGAPVPLAATALRRLLGNLVENAQRHAGGQVDIVCRRLHGGIYLGVRDRGPGIPPSLREAVFQPFFRGEASRSRAIAGSGLGLAIARQLADTHGWVLRLIPRVGGGSSFWLHLSPHVPAGPSASGPETDA